MMADSIQPFKRSFTLSSRPLRTRHSLGSYDTPNIPIPSDDLLFYHSFATIIKFELPQSSSSSPILPDLDYPVDAVETLPWKTRSETVAAVGALRIENIAGSTSFLKSGNVVYALLKNCQCWCVDGKSKFVLRIRKLTYYRIQFPGETEDDMKKVENWKTVISKIIRYEITPCPFKRGFSVELPEEAKTPKKKRAWRPKTTSSRSVRPLDFDENVSSEDRETSNLSSAGDDTDGFSERSESRPPSLSRSSSLSRGISPAGFSKRTAFRAVSEPMPKFEVLLEKFQAHVNLSGGNNDDVGSVASDSSSFHSVIDTISAPATSLGDDLGSQVTLAEAVTAATPKEGHTRNASTATVVGENFDPPSRPRSISMNIPKSPFPFSDSEPFTSNTLSSSFTELPVENPNSIIRRRIRASRQRSFSPLPPPSTLFTPTPKSPVNSLIEAIFDKTYTFVLGPPIHLLVMFLRLAAEVAAGDNAHGPATPCTGSTSSSSQLEQMTGSEDVWSEDDFGIPLSQHTSSRPDAGNFSDSGSGEID